jgi:GNAT superfamily N-acetyltransferase
LLSEQAVLVDDEARGLGGHVLSAAVCEARERSYRHGAIAAGTDNDRIFAFYSHHGFQAVDWTYEFVRELNAQ